MIQYVPLVDIQARKFKPENTEDVGLYDTAKSLSNKVLLFINRNKISH